MKIAVCCKRVPKTEARINVKGDGSDIDPAGIEFELAAFDQMALEEAIRWREANKATELTMVTLGSAAGSKEIRTGLAMGADKALHLTFEGLVQPDAAAKLLADELKPGAFDVIWTGKQATDDDHGQVGQLIALHLGLPCVTLVTKVDHESVGTGKLVVHHDVEGGTEIVEVATPCVLTAQKGLTEPRNASLKGIMAAKKKPLEAKAVTPPASGIVNVKMTPPPPRPAGKIVGEGPAAVGELLRLLKEEAKVL
jgi:electron transfer flavoprotein beta subunit